MGGALKAVTQVIDVVKPFISAVNPALGAGLGVISSIAKGENPLKALMGAVTDFIPNAGVLKNMLSKFISPELLDSKAGNFLVDALFNVISGKKGVTEVLQEAKQQLLGNLTQTGQQNLTEQAAFQMGRQFQAYA